LIHSDAFDAYMRERGHSPGTIREYRRRVAAIAYRLVEEHHGLSDLRRDRVPALLTRYLRRGCVDLRMYRSALHCWLRFRGRFSPRPPAFQPWMDDFLAFLDSHRGLVESTRENYRCRLLHYLRWQFGSARPDWTKVQVEDIWRYADHCARTEQPLTVRGKLGTLRLFLNFVHLRGACSAQLPKAVPKIAHYRASPLRTFLNPAQRHRLLHCFDRRRATGLRDYTLALLMIDLGLRIGEVVRLRLPDVDFEHRTLAVPPVKTGRGRTLPLPAHIADAIARYVQTARASSTDDRLFLRDRVFRGRPLTVGATRLRLIEAYRRCRFPQSWAGAHILRRTFASRLYRRGATLRQVADLLGHRRVTTTGVYTQVAVQAMRSLAQPWPCSP
jgi:site-specific recombinase XerD